jgi:hypothetical protein
MLLSARAVHMVPVATAQVLCATLTGWLTPAAALDSLSRRSDQSDMHSAAYSRQLYAWYAA